MPWWSWIATGALLLIGEIIISTDFYLVFFAAAALILGFSGLLGPPLPIATQWLLFAALSIGTLVLFRKRVRRAIATREGDVDRLEAQIAIATEPMAVGERGHAELRGSTWSALNSGAEDIAVGDRCRVDQVNGVVLSIRKDPDSLRGN